MAGAARGHWLSVLPRAGGSRAPLLVQNEAAARHVSSAGPLANETAWGRSPRLPHPPAARVPRPGPAQRPLWLPHEAGTASAMPHGRKRLGDPGLCPRTRPARGTRTEPVSPDPEARSSGGPWEPACPGRASAAGVRAALGHLFLPPLATQASSLASQPSPWEGDLMPVWSFCRNFSRARQVLRGGRRLDFPSTSVLFIFASLQYYQLLLHMGDPYCALVK